MPTHLQISRKSLFFYLSGKGEDELVRKETGKAEDVVPSGVSQRSWAVTRNTVWFFVRGQAFPAALDNRWRFGPPQAAHLQLLDEQR